MTNIYEINDLVEFLHEHNITMKQFMYCMLLHHDKRLSRIEGTHKISRPLSKLYKYHNNIEGFSRAELQDLVDKKFLSQEGNSFKPDMLDVTDKFSKAWYGDKFKFDDLKDIYPKYVENFDHPGGRQINLCIIRDIQGTRKLYNSLVKTQKMHKRVLELTQWAIDNDMINMNIENFVNSKFWEQIEQRQKHGNNIKGYTSV